jgi:hypothetical protein
MPPKLLIVTGVPRAGEDYPDKPSQIPGRQSLANLSSKKDEFQED